MLKANETAIKLGAARGLIANKRDWCTGEYIQNGVYGKRYCAVGAVAITCGISFSSFKSFFALFFNKELKSLENKLNEQALKIYGKKSIISVNDKLGHSAVMTCYNAAIDKAQSEY